MVEIAYIDESYDEAVFTMSALIVPADAWRESFTVIQKFRRMLKEQYGVFSSKEFHATRFVAGRGRIAPKVVPKGLRAAIFRGYLRMLTTLPGAAVIGGAWPRPGLSLGDIHAKAFSRIRERLQKRCETDQGHIVTVVDEGRARELRKIARRSAVFNPVGSQFGAWETGSATKNIPNDRLIEDPIFKPSHQSHFLQAADFVAFALLKSEIPPTKRAAKYGLDKAYELLKPICVVQASAKDPRGLGIVRT